MPFPTNFPEAALVELVNHLNGTATLPVRQAIEDTYDVLGYGLGVAIPEGAAPPAMALSLLPQTDVERIELLTSASRVPLLKSIPWDVLLPVLIDLLKKFAGSG